MYARKLRDQGATGIFATMVHTQPPILRFSRLRVIGHQNSPPPSKPRVRVLHLVHFFARLKDSKLRGVYFDRRLGWPDHSLRLSIHGLLYSYHLFGGGHTNEQKCVTLTSEVSATSTLR
jgi:hypothetical protein